MNARDELFRFLIGYIVILPESYLSSKYKCGDSTHVTQKIYYENFPVHAIASDDVIIMNLLRSPTGHLTNLSSFFPSLYTGGIPTGTPEPPTPPEPPGRDRVGTIVAGWQGREGRHIPLDGISCQGVHISVAEGADLQDTNSRAISACRRAGADECTALVNYGTVGGGQHLCGAIVVGANARTGQCLIQGGTGPNRGGARNGPR